MSEKNVVNLKFLPKTAAEFKAVMYAQPYAETWSENWFHLNVVIDLESIVYDKQTKSFTIEGRVSWDDYNENSGKDERISWSWEYVFHADDVKRYLKHKFSA